MWRMGQIFTAPSALQHCRVTGGRASLWGIGSFLGAVRGRLAARWTSHLFAELPFRCEGPTVFHGSASDGQRPRNSDRGPSLLLSAWPWEHALELCSADAKLATSSCHVQSTFHPTSQASWEMLRSYSTDWVRAVDRNGWFIFFLFCSLDEAPTWQAFHLSCLLQCQNGPYWPLCGLSSRSRLVVVTPWSPLCSSSWSSGPLCIAYWNITQLPVR